jgi:hypothetical protein
MSLIPSESYSFPDLSEGANSKRRKGEKQEPEPIAQPQPESDLPPIFWPENPVENNIPAQPQPPATPTAPNPVPPLRPPVVPIVRSPRPAPASPEVPLTRTEPITTAEPVKTEPVARAEPVAQSEPAAPTEPVGPAVPKPIRPIRPIRPSQRARPSVASTAQPEGPSRPQRPVKRVMPLVPAVPAARELPKVPDELDQPVAFYVTPEAEMIDTSEEEIPDFQFPGWEEQPRHSKKHRRNKIIKFIFLEGLALALLIGSTKLEVADQFSESSLTVLYKVLMFLAVIAMAVIPVVFFALPPRLPPSRR